nr:MAG TPA: hypothetical protein [Caudoviricetes sp.]
MLGYAAMFDFLQKDQNLIVIGKHLFHSYIVSDFDGRKQVIKV